MTQSTVDGFGPTTVNLPKGKPEPTYLISGYSITINPEKLSKEEFDNSPQLVLRQLLNSPALSESEFNYLNESIKLPVYETYDKLFCKVQHLDSNKKVTIDPYKYYYLKFSFIFYPFDWVGKSHKVRFCLDKEVQWVKRKMFLSSKVKASKRVGYWKLKKGK